MNPQVFFYKWYHPRNQHKYPAYPRDQSQGYSLSSNPRPTTIINTTSDTVTIPTLTTHLKPSARSRRSLHFSRGSALTRLPSRWSGIATPPPHRPVLPQRGMGAPQRASRCSPAVCWGVSPSRLSLSVIRYPTRCVPPPGWTVPVRIPWHPGWWVSWWEARVGAGAGGALWRHLASWEVVR